jgi:chromosome segregation ATPase
MAKSYRNLTRMKKKLSGIFLVALVISACTDDSQEQELQRLTDENNQLKTELNMKDSTLTIFEESFSTIQRNLAMISEREVSIQIRSGELQLTEDARDEITKDIKAINNLLDQNKKAIAALNNQVSKQGTEMSGFQKLIGQLESDISSKEEQIGFMKENLTAANFTIEILNEMLDSAEFRNEIQSSLIQIQEQALHTAYYAAGPYKDLQRNDVLIKEGSIAGIAGSKKLKPDFNKDYFEEINTLETRTISLNSKKAELITNHPTSSYEIEGDDSKVLRILDVNRFWSSTKYLVVVTD